MTQSRFLPSPADMEIIKKLNLKSPWIWLAIWGGAGFLRPAPGTWGSVAAIPFGMILSILAGPHSLLAGIIVVIALGFIATREFQKQTNTHDNKMIVIDEVAGQWIALLLAGTNPMLIGLSFALFRLFDIVKIGPVKWCDQKLGGAAGVMMDDVVAGLYVCAVFAGLKYAGLG